MIVVRVELHKKGYGGEVIELARAEIINVGGTDELGNYVCRTLHGRGEESLDKRREQRHTTVERHPRKAEHVWNLVTKALTRMGYGFEKA